MKKILIISLLLLSLFTITSCSNSSYDKLDAYDKSIVDIVLSHQGKFSDCNGFRFDECNGKKYFVVSSTEYTNNYKSGNTRVGDAVGIARDVKYFVVDSEMFVREEYDFYNGQTVMGFTYEWDSSWDLETKKEKLALAINSMY